VGTSDPVYNPELFFLKCGHVKKNEERSDMTEIDRSGEDDCTQDEDWVRLGASTTGLNDTYVSEDQELMTCGVLCGRNAL
jgi:hypothetical protein